MPSFSEHISAISVGTYDAIVLQPVGLIKPVFNEVQLVVQQVIFTQTHAMKTGWTITPHNDDGYQGGVFCNASDLFQAVVDNIYPLLGKMEWVPAKYSDAGFPEHLIPVFQDSSSPRVVNTKIFTSIDSINQGVALPRSQEDAFFKDLRDLPEAPSRGTLNHLSEAAMQIRDIDITGIGKDLQKIHSTKVIPPQTEMEAAAGLWVLIREAILARR